MTDAGMGKRVSALEREVSLLKNRLAKAESFDGSRMLGPVRPLPAMTRLALARDFRAQTPVPRS